MGELRFRTKWVSGQAGGDKVASKEAAAASPSQGGGRGQGAGWLQPGDQEGLTVLLLRSRDGSPDQAFSFPASQPWAPESAENTSPGEAAAQSQKLLREHWQQDAIVRPQSRYFRGNQKHQLGK